MHLICSTDRLCMKYVQPMSLNRISALNVVTNVHTYNFCTKHVQTHSISELTSLNIEFLH